MTKDERTEFGPVKVPYTLLYPKTSERSREGGLTGKEIPNILGEATSAQLIGQAIAKNPAFITLRKIEAAREIAQTISKSSNKVYLNADELLLNLQEMKLDNSE
ncbi:hypothetical protein WN944_027724 [Citrus x changshan-huyou]|uniref:Prohibitin n=1 Tax=Citrus x changshan-huyou TaxID=2935761 RepID=A0AAP0LI12_9ROSI